MFFKNIEVSLLQDGDNGQFVVQSKNGNQDSLLHIAGQYSGMNSIISGSFANFDIHLDTNIYRISRNNHWEIAGSEWVKLKDFTLNGPGQEKSIEGYPYTSEDESEKGNT